MNKPYIFCVVDVHPHDRTGFTVIREPSHFVTSISLAPKHTVQDIVNQMIKLVADEEVNSFWIESDMGVYVVLRDRFRYFYPSPQVTFKRIA